jgi:hypothetical protein
MCSPAPINSARLLDEYCDLWILVFFQLIEYPSQLPGNSGLTMAFGIQSSHVTCTACDGRWSPMRSPASPGLCNAGFDALAENLTLLTFPLCVHGQDACGLQAKSP